MMNRKSTKAAVLAAVVLATAALSACGSSGSSASGGAASGAGCDCGPSSSQWAQTVAAAQKEGTVTVSAFPSSGNTTTLIDNEFTKLYGIKVQEVPMTSEFSAQYQTELAAGKVSIDIRESGESECASLEADHYTESYGTLPIHSLPASTWLYNPFEYLKYGPGVLMNQVSSYFLVVNKAQFPGNSGPTSYKDLADPKYKGKILLDKPGGVSFGGVWAATAWEAPGYGESYVKAVLANVKAVGTSASDELNQVANGSAGILVHAISGAVSQLATIPNSPVKIVTPSDGIMVSIGALCMMKDAPHPAAAKVYMNYIDGLTAQKFYAAAPGGDFIRTDIKPIDPKLAPIASKGAKFFPGSPLPYNAYVGSNPFYFTIGNEVAAMLPSYHLG